MTALDWRALGGYYVLDEQGKPAAEPDPIRWAKWFETADRRVALDKVGEYEISTIFMGIDHKHGDGPPVLWESMVFAGDESLDCQRYCSREAAINGHLWLIAEWLARVERLESTVS